jgi:phage gpG-like protein
MPRITRQHFPDFKREQQELTRLFAALPRLAGNIALNHYDSSWDREGYLSNRLSRWKQRARPDANQARLGPRKILVRTGRLRRSLQMRVSGKTVTIYTDAPYAQAHNEGFSGTVNQRVKAHTRRGRPVRAHSRTMNVRLPQRQFMDIPGRPLNPLIEKRIVMQIEKALTKIYG